MKYKTLVTSMILSTSLYSPALAEIVDYTDDYVSFSYDDEMIGKIERDISAESNSLNYDLFARNRKEDGAAGCHFGITLNDYEVAGYDFGISSYEGKENEDNPSKILNKGSERFSHISLYESENEDYNAWARVFYDSFKVNGGINVDNLEFQSDDSTVVFSNEILSDQGYTYCEQALDILNGYMDMSIDPDDASSEIKKLSDRVDSYCEDSDYYADSAIYSAIFLSHLNIDMGKDGEVQESIDELNQLMMNKPE